MSNSFIELMKVRRTIYALGDKVSHSQAQFMYRTLRKNVN